MLTYIIRRLLLAIPTLLFISLAIFLLLDLAPGDPLSQMPLTIPPEVKEKIRIALGLGEPMWVRYLLWLRQFFINEPLHIIANMTGWDIASGAQRVISWQTRSPVADIIAQRLPQTLWVVGMSYLVGVLIALPIGIVSAYRQYSLFDQVGTFVSMVGFSVPTFFTGVLMIVVFSVQLGWFPSIYDTTLRVHDWGSFMQQVRQMVMPVAVLSLYNAAQISRFMRASMLDNLNQDYVRTARAKDLTGTSSCWSCAAQLADPGGDRDRARRADHLRRRHHHRAGVQGERARPAPDHRDLRQRPADGADARLHLRHPDRAVQPGRRRGLRRPRPEDPL